MKIPRVNRCVVVAFGLFLPVFTTLTANAVSPASVEQGRHLFERNWTARNPTFGSDGLGPLFNGQSCVACHHQSGIGGGGEAEFNAKTVGVERISITGGHVDDDVVARMIRTFHPGFVQGKTVVNTLVISHHGGSPMYNKARDAILSQLPAQFSSNGGPLDAEETRRSYATPILFSNKVGPYSIALQARLFHRNTTALFGAGVLDQISDREIIEIAKAQQKHPEISGRPSTLKGGRIGKFGWRANVASLIEFNDQACANEVGLETRRKRQGRDPMMPAYRNPAHDIEDPQIEALNAFVAALPAPVRAIPGDSEARMRAEYGERVFANIGCADCHVPDMGPAKGIYSDILLHDMGYELIDLNHAEPYVLRRTPVSRETQLTDVSRSTTTTAMTYYGASSVVTTSSSSSSGSPGGSTSSRPRFRSPGYQFAAPTGPAQTIAIIPVNEESSTNSFEATEEDAFDETITRGSQSMQVSGTRNTTTRTRVTTIREDYVRVHYEKTNFNQEWRTPPLWGVRDSAPYMHDGRAETLLESIAMHDGEAAGTRDRFLRLSLADRHALIEFLETLVAPPNVPQPAM